jgi:hypothetical protein
VNGVHFFVSELKQNDLSNSQNCLPPQADLRAECAALDGSGPDNRPQAAVNSSLWKGVK